jgi:hypothetical protein
MVVGTGTGVGGRRDATGVLHLGDPAARGPRGARGAVLRLAPNPAHFTAA